MKTQRHQRGMSGVLVLAAIVLLGGLMSWATGLVSAGADANAQSLSLARAEQAANSGLDWARWRITAAPAAQCAATQNVVVPGVLGGWTVTVRCTLIGTYTEAGVTRRRYQLGADACNQPQFGACPSAVAGAGYTQFTAPGTAER